MADIVSAPRKTTHSGPTQSGEPAAAGAPEFMDVWSRSGSKYRIRAVVLLAVNVLLFAGVGCFAFWLRSGERFAPMTAGYWDQLTQTFWGVGSSEVSLGSLLLQPISVQDVPMQILIVGLLMAALISIPILVALLYRYWSCLPFIAVVGFLAVMPWLAITLLGSCVIASVKPFRTRFRFMSALAGLIPAMIYLLLAWRGTAEAIVGRIDPVDRIKFIAPWVLAIVAAALVFALVLMIAKIVNYRPGAIAPLLAIMFGLPVALFELNVGRDELHYRLLEALDKAYFTDVDASVEWQKAARRAWGRHPMPRPPWEVIREIEEQKWLFELATDLGPFQSDLTRHQEEIAYRCDWFHKQFPSSRYMPNALYLKARAREMRVDTTAFRQEKWIRFYNDFPSTSSKNTWHLIYENCGESILSAVAGLRIAHFDAREGHVDRAMDKLVKVLQKFDSPSHTESISNTSEGPLQFVLARGAPEASLNIPMERILLETHRLYDLFRYNRDPIYGYEPITGPLHNTDEFLPGLIHLDSRIDQYIPNLMALKSRYPNGQILDNIDLEIAKATPERNKKIELLENCIEQYPDRDAIPEVLLRLSIAYRKTGSMDESEKVLRKLLERYPESVWARQARRFYPMHRPIRVTQVQP